MISRYYGQLCQLQSKFIFDEEQVTRDHSSMHGRSRCCSLGPATGTAIAAAVRKSFLFLFPVSSMQLEFEKASILFNAAAIHALTADQENKTNAEGIKKACGSYSVNQRFTLHQRLPLGCFSSSKRTSLAISICRILI